MARAGYANVVADSFGNRLAGASVEVRQPGTTSKVAGPLYAGPTGAATLGNPLLANSLGAFVFYRDAAETVDLYVTAPGYQALTLSGVAVAADAPVLDGSQLVAGSVTGTQLANGAVGTAALADGAVTAAKIQDGTLTDADVAAANKDGLAAVASLRTLGTGTQQAAAGNHGHAPRGGSAQLGTNFTSTTTGAWTVIGALVHNNVAVSAGQRLLAVLHLSAQHSVANASCYFGIYWNGVLVAASQYVDMGSANLAKPVALAHEFAPGAVTANLEARFFLNTAGTLTVIAGVYSGLSYHLVGP